MCVCTKLKYRGMTGFGLIRSVARMVTDQEVWCSIITNTQLDKCLQYDTVCCVYKEAPWHSDLKCRAGNTFARVTLILVYSSSI